MFVSSIMKEKMNVININSLNRRREKMKKYFTYAALMAVFGLMASGCSTTSGSAQDNFGYSRPEYKPEPAVKKVVVVEERTVVEDSDEDWVNPLAEEETESVTRVRYTTYYTSPMYVPVIVPWWNGYYGWMGRPYYSYHYRHHWPSVYFHYGHYCGWDWYSPWYDYNPYYGYNWGGYYHYGYNYRHYHGWYHQPVYSYNPKRVVERKNRNFGPNRRNYGAITGSAYTGSGLKSVRGSASTSPSGGIISSGSKNGQWKSIYKDRQSSAAAIRRAETARTTNNSPASYDSRSSSRANSSGTSSGFYRNSSNSPRNDNSASGTRSDSYRNSSSRPSSGESGSVRRSSSSSSKSSSGVKTNRSSSSTKSTNKSTRSSSGSRKSSYTPKKSSGSSSGTKSRRSSSVRKSNSSSSKKSYSPSRRSSGSSSSRKSYTPSRRSNSSSSSSKSYRSSRSSGSSSKSSRSSSSSRSSRSSRRR